MNLVGPRGTTSGLFVLVTRFERDDVNVEYSDGTMAEPRTVPLEDFLTQWSGYVLVAGSSRLMAHTTSRCSL